MEFLVRCAVTRVWTSRSPLTDPFKKYIKLLIQLLYPPLFVCYYFVHLLITPFFTLYYYPPIYVVIPVLWYSTVLFLPPEHKN